MARSSGKGAAAEDQEVDEIFEFPTIHSFEQRHRSATETEWKREQNRIEVFNKTGHHFKAFVIKVPEVDGPDDYFIFRVDIDKQAKQFPGIGQACKIRIVDGDDVSKWHTAQMCLTLKKQWRELAEFNVADYASPGWDLDERVLGKPTTAD